MPRFTMTDSHNDVIYNDGFQVKLKRSIKIKGTYPTKIWQTFFFKFKMILRMPGWKWMDYGVAKEGEAYVEGAAVEQHEKQEAAIQKRLASWNSHTHDLPRARWQHIYTCVMSLNSTGLLPSHNSVCL